MAIPLCGTKRPPPIAVCTPRLRDSIKHTLLLRKTAIRFEWLARIVLILPRTRHTKLLV